MATYHCTVKSGGKGKGSAHADYIAREGRYAAVENNRDRYSKYEDLVCSFTWSATLIFVQGI